MPNEQNREHTAYPLDWPPGWPRTAPHRRKPSAFQMHTYENGREYKVAPSISNGRARVFQELERLGAQYAVISTNVPARLDGSGPIAKAAQPEDPGAAIYFALKGKPHVLACDKWNRVGCNLAAIAKHIEALRGIDRWGVGSIERAFAGFAALPPPGAETAGPRPWREVLDVACPPNPDAATREAFLMMAEARHKAAAIHAGKKEIVDDVDGVLRMIAHQTGALLSDIEGGYRSHRYLGGFVGGVTITDCVSSHASEWFNGPHAFILAKPQWLIAPLAWRGERGFFDVPKEALDKLYLPALGLHLGLQRDATAAKPDLPT